MPHLLLDLAKSPAPKRKIPFAHAKVGLFATFKAAKRMITPEEPHGIYVLPRKKAACSIAQAAPTATPRYRIIPSPASAARPNITNRNGVLTTTVVGSVLADEHTLTDLLGKIPGIISDQGGISVFGGGSPIYYIDNRRVRSGTELSMIDVKNIRKVELLTNAGAKYGADVTAVIKIYTLHRATGLSVEAGANGSLSERFSHLGTRRSLREAAEGAEPVCEQSDPHGWGTFAPSSDVGHLRGPWRAGPVPSAGVEPWPRGNQELCRHHV